MDRSTPPDVDLPASPLPLLRRRILPVALALVLLCLGTRATVPAAAGELILHDPAGEPLEGVQVELLGLPSSSRPTAALTARVYRGATGEDGRVSEALPHLGDLLLLADHPSFAPEALWWSGVDPSPVRLRAGEELVVHLRSPDGHAIESGSVCARWTLRLAEWRRTHAWERCTEVASGPAGADGPTGERTVRLQGLEPDAPVVVTASIDGFLPARLEVGPAHGPLPPLELAPGVPVSGRILDPNRQPVVGARVRVEGGGEGWTGGDGRFLVAAATLPTALAVEARGLRPLQAPVRPLPERAPGADSAASPRAPFQELRMDWSQGIRAHLVDDQGAPVEHWEAWLRRFDSPSSWSTEHFASAAPADATDAIVTRRAAAGDQAGDRDDALLDLALDQPGRFELRIEAPGHEPLVLEDLVLAAGEHLDLGVLELRRGAVVRGRVVDPATGEGLPGVAVRLVPTGHAWVHQLLHGGARRTATGEDGGFEIAGAEPGAQELRLRRDGLAPAIHELTVEADTVHDLGELALGAGVAVTGRVVDAADTPRPGVRVVVHGAGGQGFEPFEEVWTDADGRFDRLTLQAGEYRLEVHGERQLSAQTVTVPTDEEELEVTLRVSGVHLLGLVRRGEAAVTGGRIELLSARDPGRMRGAVLLHTGGGQDRATDHWGTPDSFLQAPVDGQGRFELTDAPAGPVLVTWHGPTGERVSREIIVPDRARASVTVELDGEILRGRVVDADTGVGVAATVRLRRGGQPAGMVLSAADGTLEVPDLAPGLYAVEASAPGYADTVRTGVPVGVGAAPLELGMRSGDNGRLRVHLGRGDGTGAAHVPVSLLDAAGGLVRGLTTNASGHLEIQDLSPGTYFVAWSDPVTGAGASEPVTVPAGEATAFDALLAPAGFLALTCRSGEAICAGGAPDHLALYSLQGVDVTPFLATAATQPRFSADGHLPLGKVAPGRYLLQTRVAGQTTERVVALEPGGVVSVPVP